MTRSDASSPLHQMSESSQGADPERPADAPAEVSTGYGQMLDTLDVAIDEARRKIDSGRVYDAENEKVRIKWIRALAYAINVRRQVTHDRDLEVLAERLEQLEEQRRLD